MSKHINEQYFMKDLTVNYFKHLEDDLMVERCSVIQAWGRTLRPHAYDKYDIHEEKIDRGAMAGGGVQKTFFRRFSNYNFRIKISTSSHNVTIDNELSRKRLTMETSHHGNVYHGNASKNGLIN